MIRNSLNFKSVLLLILIFIISSNLAWLNPKRSGDIIKINEKIPILWQYDLDAPLEIVTAAYFPSYFFKDDTRMDRPLYPFLVSSIGKSIGFAIKPVVELNEIEKAGIGYLTLKIIVYSISIFLLGKILIYYLPVNYVFFVVFITYTTNISIQYFTTFHTTELQFITPILTIYLFLNISSKYTLYKNIFFSFIFGCLMLAKINYAIYLAIIFFLMFKNKWIEIVISLLSHSLPLLLYIYFLQYIGLEYRSYGIENASQGSWILNELLNQNIVEIIKIIFYSILEFNITLLKYYNFWILFFIVGLFFGYIHNKINKNILIFVLLFIFTTFIQMFFAKRYFGYMTSDLSIIVYSFAILGFLELIKLIRLIKYEKLIINSFMVLSLSLSLMSFVSFPWVHPYDQKSKNISEMSKQIQSFDKNLNLDKYSLKD